MAYYEGTVVLRHYILYMNESRASTLVYKIFSLELQTDVLNGRRHKERTVSVRASWRRHPLCSLHTQSRVLFALYPPFLFARLLAAIARQHQRINAPFLWLMPFEWSSLPHLSHVLLARTGTNDANSSAALRFVVQRLLPVIVLCQRRMH